MRLLIANCTVDYDGRLAAHLPPAVRLVMVKADGCVSVHSDGGAYKPLNWMNAPNAIKELNPLYTSDKTGDSNPKNANSCNTLEKIRASQKISTPQKIWEISSNKGNNSSKKDVLRITFHEILADYSFEFGSDPGLQKDGVEAHLQELLAAAPETMGEGFRLVRREFPTNIGPVDLLLTDADGKAVAVEIKRHGEMDSVEQLSRYLEFIKTDPKMSEARGILVAQVIKPQARVLAKRRQIECQIVDYDELRGIQPTEPRLF